MESILLTKLFEIDRWNDLMIKANEKHINLSVLKQLCIPQTRVRLYEAMRDGKYEVSPPRCILIPKDTPGEFREVKANEDVDRCVLTLINDLLFEMFPEMVHKSCTSYQRNLGCQETVQKASREIVRQNAMHKGKAYKTDLSKYFDNTSIKWIDWAFDTVEDKLGVERNTDPVINVLRKCFHSDLLFSVDGELEERYTGLKQGNAVGSWLADVILYAVDEEMTKMCTYYVRYSDDMLLFSEDDKAIERLKEMLPEYGLCLNPKKVEVLDADHFFKFLGFNIKGDMITLSKNRVKKFQKEIEKRTINKRNITVDQARRNVIKYLYEGEMSWATSCLGTVNVKADLDQMNLFIMDCLRAVQTGKKKIGGLGVVTNLPDRTILRGTGKNVTANRRKTEKEIPNYFSMGTLANAMKISKSVYGACVRSM